jgi:pentatricopeptide repeat protein
MDTSMTQRLGDFEIMREIGRGGMGVVYQARQVSLNRQVALKVLSGRLGLMPKTVQRFRREAEAAAKLHHTNIVPVYAIGEDSGTHFYAMELIDGPSLDHVIHQMKASRETHGPESASVVPSTDTSLSPELAATGPYAGESGSRSTLSASSLSSHSHYFDTVARMVAEVADALDYAHKNGVIHRDLKPSNLLLSPAGRLSLNDFGLARVFEQPGMTLSGEFVGTPAYMSPEQITAGRIPLDHRTDIYSLGATVYELLTLEPPFTGKSREQVLAQIMQKEPKAPRRIQKRVPVDLETICLKCLEKDPDRRYQTAVQLAEDLRRYVNRFAISARRAGLVRRLVKWVRRRPAVAASLGCFLVAVGAAFVFAYQAHRVEQQRVEERERGRLQLLDEKISKAFVAATSGDLQRTDKAIKEIEDLGASTGQVRLVQGAAYYFGGDSGRAISELEQAAKLLPDSVAAVALLSASYSRSGQWERADQLFDQMIRLSPSCPEDYLFKGLAQEAVGDGGLATITEGIRRSDSPLGPFLRARPRSNQAFDTRNLKEAEEALKDIEAARRLMPDNALVVRDSIVCREIAAVIYQEANVSERRAAVLKEAERDIRAIEPVLEKTPILFFSVWFFYEQTGERGKALEIARRWLKSTASPHAAELFAIDLYHLGRFSEALQCVNHGQSETEDLLRMFVLAETIDGPHLTLQEYEKSNRKGDMPAVLLLLGKKEQAVADFQKAEFERTSTESQDRNEFNDAEMLFLRGQLSVEKLLAKASLSRTIQSKAHFYIGLLQLATGDRAGARDHFREGARWAWGHYVLWCQMFLGRMEKDPTWPPWIPLKK